MGGGGSTSGVIRREVARLSRVWQVDLGDVELRINPRLTRSLGRADLSRGRVSLSPRAVTSRELLRDVLRHELAHIAAVRLGAKREPHHGPTWRKLLRLVGVEPRVKQRSPLPAQPAKKQRRFRHECPVCDFVRVARKRVPNWRCADCVAVGLSGVLTITEVTNA